MVRQHMLTATAPNGDRREIEFKIVRPDGEVRWLLDRGQAMPNGRDRQSGSRVDGHDARYHGAQAQRRSDSAC